MKRVVSTMHLAEITIAYGMTETSPVSFQSSTTDPLGATVAVGETGKLCTRGYSVMKG